MPWGASADRRGEGADVGAAAPPAAFPRSGQVVTASALGGGASASLGGDAAMASLLQDVQHQESDRRSDGGDSQGSDMMVIGALE